MTNSEHQRTMRIHIDRVPLGSPDPTTGNALYRLGAVADHSDLFREVDGGSQEDQIVPRSDEPVHLHPDEHFYSQKETTIIVNTEKKEAVKRRLSFDEVVALDPELPPPGPNILYTVDYADGPPQNPKGAMRKGDHVGICDGMKFDVAATDRS